MAQRTSEEIVYTSTLRNWTSLPAFQVSRFLNYYRLAGKEHIFGMPLTASWT